MKISYGTVRNLLALGAVFVPFTSLRFGPVGVGELSLIVALFFLLALNGWRLYPLPATAPLLFFWTLYPLWLIFGFGYNVLFLGYSSGSPFSAIFDFVAYLFILALIIVLGDRRLYEDETPAKFFERIFFYWAVVFSLLFALSYMIPSVLGLPLRYYSYFSPLVDNVHQTAMITCAMTFVMLFLAFNATKMRWKTIYLVFTVLFAQMALESGSTKAWVALLIGAVATFTMLMIHRPAGKGHVVVNIISYSLTTAAAIFFVTRYWSVLVAASVEFFREEDTSSGRENLYYYGFSHAMNSPVFGYGPGAHISYNDAFWDAHSTMLTALLQGGLAGGLMFVVLFARIIARASVSSALTGAIAAIGIYALGGDILRRLPIWIVIVGVLLVGARETAAPKPRGLARARVQV